MDRGGPRTTLLSRRPIVGASLAALIAVALGVPPTPRATARADGTAAVVIEAPAEGAVVPRQVRVSGRVPVLAGGARGSLRVNGADVAAPDGRFETVVTGEADGPLRIRVAFAEIGVPALVSERVVVVDGTPPTIEMDLPRGEVGEYATPEATIRGLASDPHLASVALNGKEVPFDRDGAFEGIFLLPVQGEQVVEIAAVDVVGNRSATRRVLRSAPEGKPPPVPAAPPARPDAVRQAISDALRWLAAHQSPDGGWECAGFPRWCDGKPAGGPVPDGRGNAAYDPGVTGLSLLAFLAAMDAGKAGDEHAKVVEGGLRYLKGIQDEGGCFGPRTSGHFVYNHALATWAMVEGYRRTGRAVWKGPAQRGLDFIALARNPTLAWRYGVRPVENDTCVTGWMVTALRSAKDVGASHVKAAKPPPFSVDEAAFDGARAWIERMTDPDRGRVGYVARGVGPADRPVDLVDKFPIDKSEATTAVGTLVRIEAGEDPKTSPLIQKGAALCGAVPPAWNPTDGSIDMYYWYFATRALSAVGGPAWASWRDRLLDAVLTHQRRDTDPCMHLGSWDPVDPWGRDGGRVYSTAILALTLVAAGEAPPRADPGPARAAASLLLRRLRDRAIKWAELREHLTTPCADCNGTGKDASLRVPCGVCGGRGTFPHRANLRAAYYEMRSPAARARPEASPQFEALVRGLSVGSATPASLTGYKLGKSALLDDTHATLQLFENGAAQPIEMRWIWSSEPRFPAGTWYLYTDVADGDWPP